MTIETKQSSVFKAFGWLLGTCIIVILSVIAMVQIYLFYSNVRQSWNEILFAYQNPSVVRIVRQEYQQQQQKLEQSFLQRNTLQTK